MIEQSPAQFASKLRRLPAAVKGQQRKGIEARALVTKRIVLATAAGSKRYGKPQPNWVQYRIVADDVAAVRLRGGFAHLTEMGSYKKPAGWDETPKNVTERRSRAAAKKGLTLHSSAALHTPYGPRASVHHPALRARPFWKAGIDAARKPGHDAYRKVVVGSLHEALR